MPLRRAAAGGETAVPVGVVRAKCGSGRGIGRQAKQGNRRCTPLRPPFRLAGRMDEPSQPAHRARRVGPAIISGPGDDRNRHRPGDFPPPFPFVKISQIVRAHEPDEAGARVAPAEGGQGVDGETRAGPRLEIADPDRRAAGHRPRRGHPRGHRRHVLRSSLKRVARRNQPPDFVEPERVERREADPAVPAVGRIERSAEESDAHHAGRSASMASVERLMLR